MAAGCSSRCRKRLGEDAADLIGSVLLHRAWQAAQRLGPLAHSSRPPFLCLIDECHRFCHLPQGMSNALAQARGYGARAGARAPAPRAGLADHELAEADRRELPNQAVLRARRRRRETNGCAFPAAARRLRPASLGDATRSRAVSFTKRTSCPPRPPGRSRRRSQHRATRPAAIRERARGKASQRQAVEATIRERYGRIEQPPPGHAHADEQQDPAGEVHVSRGVGAPPFDPPYDPPFDPPSEGGPPPLTIPHHDSDPWPDDKPRQ